MIFCYGVGDYMSDVSVDEIRRMIYEVERKILSLQANNRLKKRYLAKISYMLQVLRLIPCKKNVLENWVLPDERILYLRETEKGLI